MFHSEAAQMSPLHCLVKTEPQKSKYEGKPPYVILVMDDGAERNYTVENEACGNALRPLKGKKVMLQFTGSREDAAIAVLGAGAAPQSPAPEAPQQQAPPQDFQSQPQRQRTPAPAAAQKTPEQLAAEDAQHAVKAKREVAQRAHLMFLCVKGAYYAAQQAFAHTGGELTLDADAVQRMGVSIYMDAQRDGLFQHLSVAIPAAAQKGAAK